MIIKKDIKFDCCHMLSNYEGKCNNLHGHTYHGSVEISADVDKATGMVLDYNAIKTAVDMLDHAIIFSDAAYRDDAEDELFTWANANDKKYFVVRNGKSTAEHIAQKLGQHIVGLVTQDCDGSVTVTLSETDGSWATYKEVL